MVLAVIDRCTLICLCFLVLFFFFNDTATTEIYTLSLHDALPIYLTVFHRFNGHFFELIGEICDGLGTIKLTAIPQALGPGKDRRDWVGRGFFPRLVLAVMAGHSAVGRRSEEHTSELQSLTNLVCRLLLEKKKQKQNKTMVQFNSTPIANICTLLYCSI